MKTFEELVTEGKKLSAKQVRIGRQVSELKWAWADLALEVAPSHTGNAQHSKVTEKLERFKIAVGNCPYTTSSLLNSRYVAKSWPPEERVKETSFEVHKLLRNHKHLIKPCMNRMQARELLGYKNTPPRRKIQFQRLIDEISRPEIIDRIWYEFPEVAEQIIAAKPRRKFFGKAA